MPLFLVSNQHQPEACPALQKELVSHYKARVPSGDVNVWCNCAAGEHRMFYLVDAPSAAGAIDAVPAGTTRTGNTVTQVEEAYRFATGG